MIFEVGKQYQYDNNIPDSPIYTCVYIGKTQSIFSYDDGKLTCPINNNTSKWSEVKPKIKLEKWIALTPSGNIRACYGSDPRKYHGWETKIKPFIAAVLHINEEVEEGQGM